MDTPLVAILAGASTDLPVMEDASVVLRQLGIPHTLDVMSVQRDADELRAFVTGAKDAGYQVVIAGSAGAGPLAGVVAAWTSLPVIGVPCRTVHLGGADALYATVQSPDGVPVATVGIDAARNAGILAGQIVATASSEVARAVEELRAEAPGEGRVHRDVPAQPAPGLGFGFQPG